jgi:hypothetical protein
VKVSQLGQHSATHPIRKLLVLDFLAMGFLAVGSMDDVSRNWEL